MPLTLNQFLFLIITFAVVVAVTFLVLFLIQLRKTALEGEKTLTEIRELVKDLKETERKVNAAVDDLGETIQASKKAVTNLSEIILFLTTKVIRPASKYWPVLFPLLRFGWQQLKKRKEKKNE
jgi:predicted PurR-regulated permease PerM